MTVTNTSNSTIGAPSDCIRRQTALDHGSFERWDLTMKYPLERTLTSTRFIRHAIHQRELRTKQTRI